ncbi:MAG: hypothetical protein QM831_20410 [Kofleriaceae bacterium]
MGDLSVTALYTSQVWAWAKLPCSELCATVDAKRVFDVTNAALTVAQFGRPLLPYALLHRHLIIDRLLQDRPGAVTEIAAGLSRRGAANCATRDYTEVDLAPVIAKKKELLARTPEGKAVLDKLRFVEGDVTKIDIPPAPTVIAEGLCMYLRGDDRRALFAKIPGDFIFDLVPADEEPPQGRSGKLLEAAMKRFTGGRTFEKDARTRQQIVDELRAAGFPDVHIYTPDVFRDLPHLDRKTTMVVFSAMRASRA